MQGSEKRENKRHFCPTFLISKSQTFSSEKLRVTVQAMKGPRRKGEVAYVLSRNVFGSEETGELNEAQGGQLLIN